MDHYQPCIDNLQDRFRTFEQALFSTESKSDNLQDFYDLKNELLNLQAVAVPLIDICTQLLRFHSDIIPKENRIYQNFARKASAFMPGMDSAEAGGFQCS